MNTEFGEIGGEQKNQEQESHIEKEPDLPPEYCHYRDEGCEYAVSCLDCPFPHCLYDEPRGKQRWLKRLRNQEIARLYGSGKWKMKDVASLFGISQRTVQRALRGVVAITTAKSNGEPAMDAYSDKGEW